MNTTFAGVLRGEALSLSQFIPLFNIQDLSQLSTSSWIPITSSLDVLYGSPCRILTIIKMNYIYDLSIIHCIWEMVLSYIVCLLLTPKTRSPAVHGVILNLLNQARRFWQTIIFVTFTAVTVNEGRKLVKTLVLGLVMVPYHVIFSSLFLGRSFMLMM